jgi:YegS/Rv2252/BmrU family lipid kinase
LNTRSYNERIAPYRQPVLIYNPTAGKIQRHPRILQRTIEALEHAGVKPPLRATRTAHHASDLAAQAIAEGADLILVLGGDGTIHEAVNGMIHSRVPLGILPAGTANVLAMELGLGSNVKRAAGALTEAVERRIAVGRLCDSAGASRYFLCMCGAGLDAKIVHDLDSGLKARAGKLAYWLGGLSHIASRVGQFEVRVKGTSYQCGFALASRVRNYGGVLEIASGASLLSDDFEIVLLEGANPLRYAWYLLGVMAKRAQSMRGVRTLRGRCVELSGDAHLQIDGEYAGKLPARLEIVPDALTLLAPSAYK